MLLLILIVLIISIFAIIKSFSNNLLFLPKREIIETLTSQDNKHTMNAYIIDGGSLSTNTIRVEVVNSETKKTKIPYIIDGLKKIPDKTTKKFIMEVKNVKKLAYTKQLKIYFEFAKEKNIKFILKTRSDTILTEPLKQAIKDYGIIVKWLPW